MFALRLNQEKSYFKGFTSKFQGIAEAESEAEQSVRMDSLPLEKDKPSKKGEAADDAKQEKDALDESGSGDDDDSSDSSDNDEKKDDDQSDAKASSQENSEKEEAPEDDEGEDENSEKNKSEVNINNYFGPDGLLRDLKQFTREESYRQPQQPEVLKTKSKWRKLEILKMFDQIKAQCYLFNYIADDYNQLLSKLWGLVEVLPSSIKFLILWLPKGAAKVDLFWAKRIQEAVCRKKSERLQTIVLFIRFEDRKRLVNQFWGVSSEGLH